MELLVFLKTKKCNVFQSACNKDIVLFRCLIFGHLLLGTLVDLLPSKLFRVHWKSHTCTAVFLDMGSFELRTPFGPEALR